MATKNELGPSVLTKKVDIRITECKSFGRILVGACHNEVLIKIFKEEVEKARRMALAQEYDISKSSLLKKNGEENKSEEKNESSNEKLNVHKQTLFISKLFETLHEFATLVATARKIHFFELNTGTLNEESNGKE